MTQASRSLRREFVHKTWPSGMRASASTGSITVFVDGVRAIMTATSDDFVQWSKPELLGYQEGIPNQHLYTNAILPYAKAPHLYIGFPTRYLPVMVNAWSRHDGQP